VCGEHIAPHAPHNGHAKATFIAVSDGFTVPSINPRINSTFPGEKKDSNPKYSPLGQIGRASPNL
jgi:hypothetical protein